METFIIILISILVILYIHHRIYFESFTTVSMSETTDEKLNMPLSVLIFVSKSCGHCVNYNKNHHDQLVRIAKEKGIHVKRIFSDEDPDNLFEKYKIMFVPSVYIMNGDKIYKNLGSNVNPQAILTELNNYTNKSK